MATVQADTKLPLEPLAPLPVPRLWPGVVLLAIFWPLSLGLQYFVPGSATHIKVFFWGPHVVTLLFLIWWFGFSRLPWIERSIIPLVGVLGGLLTALLSDKSMPFVLLIFGIPVLLTVWSVSVSLLTQLAPSFRMVVVSFAMLLTCGYFMLLRLDGASGALHLGMSYRWQPTAEAAFLAAKEKAQQPSPAESDTAATSLELATGDWPGFRGLRRDSIVRGVTINTDWKTSPPKLLWKQRIGPGWSSLAAVGERLYTQEQRGDYEAVVCYSAATGAELWLHQDETRFTEIVAGPGPRATPTFAAGRIYALGASGKLNCLDALSGKLVWTRDIATDTGAKPPTWGFSSSPLVSHDRVAVFAGVAGKSVVCYRAVDGEIAWTAGQGERSYSSPQLATIDERDYFLMVSGRGLEALDPESGAVAWEYEWEAKDNARVTQPHFIGEREFILGNGDGIGTRRIALDKSGEQLAAREVWNTLKFQPDFNDFVHHEGYLYGFDGNVFCCVDAATGERQWKKGRYGHGQVLLLADQPLLLLLSESGDVVLLEPNPQKHVELARFSAISGKTWNHPVVAHGRLIVRNGEEMACYALAVHSGK